LQGNEVANDAAVNHYNYVIDELMKRKLTPEVVLYYYDLPQALEDEFGKYILSQFFHLIKVYFFIYLPKL